ncbi:MAG: hypothetical protein AAGF84_05980 [Planctomycetota bacterium]
MGDRPPADRDFGYTQRKRGGRLMAWQLIYTSASRGLAEGSRGFCTVAATTGMPASLIPRVEALSGYRPMPADSPTPYPVQFTHVRLEHAGQTLSVVSRIVHAGHDYSGRTNKLAHHVVLEADEQSPSGPADWMRRFADWIDAWDGEPRSLPATPLRLVDKRESQAGSAWSTATGDAGYAGWLAERLLLDASRPTYVHHVPEQHDALALVDEAIAQLPEHARWRATFATYYTDPLPESDAAWRWVVQGSPAVGPSSQAIAAGNGIDLLGERPNLSPTRYINEARGDDVSTIETSAGFNAKSPYASRDSSLTSELPRDARFENNENQTADVSNENTEPAVQTSSSNSQSVPAAWFWGAVIAWPMVIAAVVWLVWPDVSNKSNLPPNPTTSHANKSALPESAVPDPQIAELRNALADANAQIDALTVAFRGGSLEADPPAERPALNPSVRRSAAETNTIADLSLTASPPPPTSDVESMPIAVPEGEPVWSAIDLPQPRLASSGSTGLGSLATLAPQDAVMWPASPGLPVERLHIKPAALRSAADLGLRWHQHGQTVTLTAERRDTLGGSRAVTLARGAWNAETGAVVWSWLPVELDRGLADALDTIALEAAFGVWHVEAADGESLATLQGRPPSTPAIQIGGDSESLEPAGLGRHVDLAWIAIDAVEIPDAWSVVRVPEATSLVLQGPSDAAVLVELDLKPRDQVMLKARWQDPPSGLAVRRSALEHAVYSDRAWLDRLHQAEQAHAGQRLVLPTDDSGEPDDALRGHPKWRAEFERLDELADAIGLVRDEGPIEPDTLEESLEAREAELALLAAKIREIEDFTGCVIELSLEASGAKLARVEVQP